MNSVFLKGYFRDIQLSHIIEGVEYCKADFLVKNEYTGNDDVISLKFKKFSNKYKEGDYAEIYGNVRSYSHKCEDGTNKVNIYVFTYQDLIDEDINTNNFVQLDGRVCKKDILRVTKSGKHNFHFTIANNIISENTNQKVNSYIPCVVWGKLAIKMSNLNINDKIEITGELHSREYKKQLENGEIEIRVAHEIVVKSFKFVED